MFDSDIWMRTKDVSKSRHTNGRRNRGRRGQSVTSTANKGVVVGVGGERGGEGIMGGGGRDGVMGGGGGGGGGDWPGPPQDKQEVARWCYNSELLCRVVTAYLTVWLGWALPQVSHAITIITD